MKEILLTAWQQTEFSDFSIFCILHRHQPRYILDAVPEYTHHRNDGAPQRLCAQEVTTAAKSIAEVEDRGE
jgi:hypothetical protein